MTTVKIFLFKRWLRNKYSKYEWIADAAWIAVALVGTLVLVVLRFEMNG